ncbi:MAG: nucleotidyltransferase domain-containing protein [Magnetococcales bacterium]|nr:nucleotidyltransferase domain-containing protein [Magnetococcales bacterium]
MPPQSIEEIIQYFIKILREDGIPVDFAVLYGSHCRGDATEWSDIDVLVVSPKFEPPKNRDDIDRMWHATLPTDVRIEPIGIGSRQWEEDQRIPLIEIARREGQIIRLH